MFRRNKTCSTVTVRFPRMRGDVPSGVSAACTACMFSPHARGCSAFAKTCFDQRFVFPACAGMFLRIRFCATCQQGFPRMRGDVPRSSGMVWPCSKFSPHARGCSADTNRCATGTAVFPACAGMFRQKGKHLMKFFGFPRMRGDVPKSWIGRAQGKPFSPHARGCSFFGERRGARGGVFPACAGMFRWSWLGRHSAPCFPRMRGDVPNSSRAPARRPWFSPHARGCSSP